MGPKHSLTAQSMLVSGEMARQREMERCIIRMEALTRAKYRTIRRMERELLSTRMGSSLLGSGSTICRKGRE